MNLKLSEWNELIKYGELLCTSLKERNYNVKLKPYTVYDGRKGLVMQVFDDFGNFMTEYYSGIDTFNIMKNTMYMNMRRIITEC